MRNKKTIIIVVSIIVAIVLLGSGAYVIKNKFDNKIPEVNSSEETLVDNSKIDEEVINTEDSEKKEVIKNEDMDKEDEKEVETTGTSEVVVEEKTETSNSSSTNSASTNNVSSNNSGSSSSGDSSNSGVSTTPTPEPTPEPKPEPTPEPTPQPTPEPQKPVATGISFSDFNGRLSGMGFSSDGFYYENGVSMGGVAVKSSVVSFALENNSTQFDSVIKNCFNLLLPTQGNRLYNIVSSSFSNQTLQMDGRTVEISLFSEGVIINIYE